MRIISYLTGQILTAMAFVVVSLTCVIWLSQSLRFVDLIVNRGLPISTFITLTFMLMPTWLSIVLPIAAFGATLFVYNRMTNDREMVVMSAAGMSPLRMAAPAMLCAIGATLLCYLMTLYLQPMSYRGFKELQFQIRHNLEHLVLKEGEFRNIGDDFTVYIRAREDDGQLYGLIVHDQSQNDKDVTLVAEQGALVESDGGPRVVMVNGSRQERDVKTGRVNILYFDRYTIDLGSMKSEAQRNYRDQNELFVNELLNPDPNTMSADDVNEHIAEGHQRLTSPLLALTLVSIGLAVMLSGEFSRRGQTIRILVAVALAGAAEAMGLGSKFIAAKEPLAIGLMWAVVIVPILLATFALSRNRMRRPNGTSSSGPVPAGPMTTGS
jgi:lipopolysaccharide export system permease protein